MHEWSLQNFVTETVSVAMASVVHQMSPKPKSFFGSAGRKASVLD